jgi:flavin-dependent dehydrogenase
MRALVIGGGPAGAALATRLAVAGREVVVLERTMGPVDKVCGEFISVEAARYLSSLDIDLSALGAVALDRVRLCTRDHVITKSLPFVAHSVSRRVLDEALLARAVAAGAQVRRGTKVNALSGDGVRWGARLTDGEIIPADAAFLATGKHDLRGRRRTGYQDDLIALKLHYRLESAQAAALEHHVELLLFEGGYAGLQPIEEGRANLCLVVRRRRFTELGQHWPELLGAIRAELPHLDERLDGARACWTRPLALSMIPYGHLTHRTDGIWRLGDQAAVIPSFSGDGLAIALHSAALAAKSYLDGRDAEHYRRSLTHDLTGQLRVAMILSHGLVSRRGQAVIGAAARRWPRLLSTVAQRTRVSNAALARTRMELRA